MAEFRNGLDTIGPKKVENVLDYEKGLDGLPKSDVLKYLLEDQCSVVVRPSGTEPKLKVYVSVCAEYSEIARSGAPDNRTFTDVFCIMPLSYRYGIQQKNFDPKITS